MAQLIIPNNNLFIVTSALDTGIGIIGAKDRLDQTIATLENLKQKVPDAAVLLVDGSPNQIPDSTKNKIAEYCQAIWWNDPDIYAMASSGRKSEAEVIMVFKTLMMFKSNPQLMQFFHSIKRIFKYSARTLINEDFNIQKYDGLFGKFVFKKRIPTWMPEIKHGATNLLITRMFSFCPSLIDIYLDVIHKNFNILDDLDTEHAHFVNIPEKYLVEFETLGCEGFLAGNGKIERY